MTLSCVLLDPILFASIRDTQYIIIYTAFYSVFYALADIEMRRTIFWCGAPSSSNSSPYDRR